VEAINMREEQAAKEGDPRLYGIVLLSDGDDTNSERNESDMLECVPVTESAEGVKVFTVAYGDEANVDLLTRVANRTGAKFYEGNPDNIDEILLEILYEQ
jgi:Ca-activated chloride channel family protein